MQNNKSWLYLPIETKVRELHGKMLLSLFAAEDGFNAVIGSRRGIYTMLPFLPKGIVFGFGLCENFKKNYLDFIKRGLKIVSWDEEGLVTFNESIYLKHRVSEKTMKLLQMFFCWGKRHFLFFKNISDNSKCDMSITGNPRFDLLRPEFRIFFNKEVDEIKKKYGKIILINTNFGYGNHYSGKDYAVNSLRRNGWMNTTKDEKYFMGFVKWQEKMFNYFKEIMPLLSEKFKEYRIIIRPHPSENREVWEKIVSGYSNISVIHSGNVIPWIMSAEVVIHNNCTTAVEAYLLDKNIISFRPATMEEYESDLPNVLSFEARNQEELVDILNKILKENYSCKNSLKDEKINFYISGIKEKTASELIIKELKKITKGDSFEKINKAYLFVYNLKSFLVGVIKKILGNFEENIGDRYIAHKMPDLNKKEIEGVIERFSKLDEKFSKVKVKSLGPECFHIYTDE